MGGRCSKKLIAFLLWNESTDGDELDWVAQAAAGRGQVTPDVVKKRPELRPDAVFYWNAFLDLLDKDWVACEHYARCYDVDVGVLWSIITKMKAARAKKK